MDKVIVGKRVRRQRESMSLTREEFAELVDISPQFLAEIEIGKKGMSAETLYKIGEGAGASTDYILMGRQNAVGEKTPAVKLLDEIPPRYSEAVEKMLRAFLQAVQIAEDID